MIMVYEMNISGFLLDITLAHVYSCLCVLGIRQLQLILLKVSLIVGVEVHFNVEFLKLQEPPQEQDHDGKDIRPKSHSHPNVHYIAIRL